MGYQKTVNTINSLFTGAFEKGDFQKVQDVFSNLSAIEAVGIYGDLSNEAISGIYQVLDDLKTTNEAKEHIAYKYYVIKIEEKENEVLEDSLVQQIINDYTKTRFLALESLIVKALKEDRIKLNQFEQIKSCFASKIIEKEIYSYRVRVNLEKGIKLNENVLLKLAEYEKYKIIENALNQSLIECSALSFFKLPDKGDKNKKIKTRLYIKASKLSKNL